MVMMSIVIAWIKFILIVDFRIIKMSKFCELVPDLSTYFRICLYFPWTNVGMLASLTLPTLRAHNANDASYLGSSTACFKLDHILHQQQIKLLGDVNS